MHNSNSSRSKNFGDKWGTPDVIGVEMSNFKDIYKGPVVIVSAEIKTDTQGLVRRFFGRPFSHIVDSAIKLTL